MFVYMYVSVDVYCVCLCTCARMDARVGVGFLVATITGGWELLSVGAGN